MPTTTKVAAALADGGDTITLLRCMAPLRMTKRWRADGTIDGYDQAKNFAVRTVRLTGIEGLHKLLLSIAADPQTCAIRGAFVGEARAQEVAPPERPGHYQRIGALYEDVPHHWLMTDVDGYRPDGVDPCVAPVDAIDQYIERRLPACFRGASYVWQLSASAGAPGKDGILKAHIWFWLKWAYTGQQLTTWARATGADIDVSVLRTVQANYTASPVFDDGMADPIGAGRIGYVEGWSSDDVPLRIDEAVLARAAAATEREVGGGGIDLTDPKGKPGLIGLFCRTFSMEEVMERWLSEVFAFQDGSERRLNFLRGGGSVGGAFISDCREYITCMHATDPLGNRATNKWDLVRHYVFGDLDDGADPLDLAMVTTRPSHAAMLDMVAGLDEVRGALREKQQETAGRWKEKVAGAADEFEIREVADEIRREKGLDRVALEQLAGLVQARFRDLGVKLPISAARGLIGIGGGAGSVRGGVVTSAGAGPAPEWSRHWCYITDGDFFFDLKNKEKVSERGYNAMHNRNMKPFADEERGIVPSASSYSLNEWHIPCVSHTTYMPGAEPIFHMLDTTWANTYRPESVPEALEADTEEGRAAVERVKAHLRRFIPDRRERLLFAAWLAHNVKRPGVKCRWAPYLHGSEGDGKSFFVDLLAAVMGARQVRTVSGSTIESNFTDWGVGYALVCVEEMKQHGHNRYDVMNRLKPFITNSSVEIHPKGKASYTAPNTANYLILSNYLDGAPIDENSRRYMFLSSGIKSDELAEMNDSGYFADLFDCLTEHAGALRHWLLGLEEVAEFDPNGRAPNTAIRKTVVELSRTETESLARDAIEQGIEGVCATAISSAHLVGFLKDRLGDEAEVKTHKVSALLTNLGFRFYERKKWRGDARKIWVKGHERNWGQIKSELDVTVGREFEFGDEGGDE